MKNSSQAMNTQECTNIRTNDQLNYGTRQGWNKWRAPNWRVHGNLVLKVECLSRVWTHNSQPSKGRRLQTKPLNLQARVSLNEWTHNLERCKAFECSVVELTPNQPLRVRIQACNIWTLNPTSRKGKEHALNENLWTLAPATHSRFEPQQ